VWAGEGRIQGGKSAPHNRAGIQGVGRHRCRPIFGWTTGSLCAEDREREKGDCNAGCDNEESIRYVAHGIPRRQKEDMTTIPLSSQPHQLRAPPAWPPVPSKRAQPLSDCAPLHQECPAGWDGHGRSRETREPFRELPHWLCSAPPPALGAISFRTVAALH
jgi:hypothetical protein